MNIKEPKYHYLAGCGIKYKIGEEPYRTKNCLSGVMFSTGDILKVDMTPLQNKPVENKDKYNAILDLFAIYNEKPNNHAEILCVSSTQSYVAMCLARFFSEHPSVCNLIVDAAEEFGIHPIVAIDLSQRGRAHGHGTANGYTPKELAIFSVLAYGELIRKYELVKQHFTSIPESHEAIRLFGIKKSLVDDWYRPYNFNKDSTKKFNDDFLACDFKKIKEKLLETGIYTDARKRYNIDSSTTLPDHKTVSIARILQNKGEKK